MSILATGDWCRALSTLLELLSRHSEAHDEAMHVMGYTDARHSYCVQAPPQMRRKRDANCCKAAPTRVKSGAVAAIVSCSYCYIQRRLTAPTTSSFVSFTASAAENPAGSVRRCH